MGKKVKITQVVDVTELGRKGGLATAANRTAEERREAARAAIKARWEQHYRDHPEQLKARREREARKGKAPRGRPAAKKSAKKTALQK